MIRVGVRIRDRSSAFGGTSESMTTKRTFNKTGQLAYALWGGSARRRRRGLEEPRVWARTTFTEGSAERTHNRVVLLRFGVGNGFVT